MEEEELVRLLPLERLGEVVEEEEEMEDRVEWVRVLEEDIVEGEEKEGKGGGAWAVVVVGEERECLARGGEEGRGEKAR